MKKVTFWIPCFVGVILTPLFFYASTLSGNSAASHAGGGFQILIFYPIPLLLAVFLSGGLNNPSSINQLVWLLCVGLAIIQFPFFGFLLSFANLKKGSVIFLLIKIIVGFHVIISILGLFLILLTLI